MKKYIKPAIHVISLNSTDIIQTSSNVDYKPGQGNGNGGIFDWGDTVNSTNTTKLNNLMK